MTETAAPIASLEEARKYLSDEEFDELRQILSQKAATQLFVPTPKQAEVLDRKAYDEVTQMLEKDVRYTLTWNRTDDPNQRVRAVLAFNPPDTPEGRWVIKYFAPWLDPAHPNPAKDGELRYFATVGEDQDYE